MKLKITLLVVSFVTLIYICNGMTNFCERRTNGYFSNPLNCNEFVHCENGKPMIRRCPTGYHFSPRDSTCDYPRTAKCPNICQTEYGLYSHPTNCYQFYHCSHGKAYLKVCPSGLHFSTKHQVCDFPFRAGCMYNSN